MDFWTIILSLWEPTTWWTNLLRVLWCCGEKSITWTPLITITLCFLPMRCYWIVCTGPSRSGKLSQPSSMKFSVTPSRVVDWRRRVYVFHSVLITAHPTWPDPAQVIKGVILQPIISDVRQQASSSIKPSSNRGLLELASWEKKKVLPLNKRRKMQLAIVMTGEICERLKKKQKKHCEVFLNRRS